MQINWFTIVAQLLNFLILVWLLKRFLYQPILDAIDAREKRIAETLQQAAATREQANSEQKKFKSLNAELDSQRTALLQQANAQADLESQKMLAKARLAADALVQTRRQEQLRDIQSLRHEIHNLTTTEVFALTREILSGLAGTSLEASMTTVFIAKLQEMPEANRLKIIQALSRSPAGGTIYSSLPLTTEQQHQLQLSINDWVGSPVPLQFNVTKSLVCGVKLSAKGQETDWNIDASLDRLEAALNASLSQANDAINTKHDHEQLK
jgi:F-type H+-transporting ATPase subunit b